SGVPSKVSALSWQVLLDRVPTRANLSRRDVIRVDEAACPMCDVILESSQHLFYIAGLLLIFGTA
ncbi:hypothetical protein A2U01_0056931, partial [Trifolium medium]|nr:hypothetical protein [Trifolium medium]